ncbi:rhodanese-like domain-containing protein [Planctellipticum variicoloris]|uniref:rhodanese-like domain-containing protein n=1 Tax=Planctellipticum variicoloris TaxID=3064265 RepID=UPI002CD01FD9|nr:rhodanese-like domain-containing protein [Planctomycetaceae bacterium SH412]HTN03305.1 rhodanese-like domain-containing protein [Planctomycetaceae bacterium]
MSALEIDCRTVKQRLDDKADFLLLDCRESTEYATARIEGSVLIPMSEITDRVQEIEAWRSKPIVVHCHHGGRSLRVTLWLRSQGFTDVLNLTGGIDEWSQQIDSTVPRY